MNNHNNASAPSPELHAANQNTALFAMITMGVVATIIIGIIPVFVAGMTNELNLGDKAIGILAATDMFGSTIASLVCLSIQSRFKWHNVLYTSVCIAITGNLLSIFSSSLESLIVFRVLTGFGNGFIIALVFIGLCHCKNPDRGFGFYTLGQIGIQTVLLALLPYLINITGMTGAYVFLACASLFSILLIQFFPTGIANKSAITSDQKTATPRWALLALTALSVYFLSVAAIWSYLEPIGNNFSLNLVEVGQALGTASLVGILGPLTVVILAAKYGRISCLAFGIILHIISALLLIYGNGYQLFFLAASLFTFALNYSFPYQMGILSTFDKNGSIAIIALIVQLASFTFGPILASFLLFGGYSLLLWVCQVSFGFAFIAYWISIRKSH